MSIVPVVNRNGLRVRFEYVHLPMRVTAVPRIAVKENSRMSLRIRPEEKALLLRAVALGHADLTDFVLRHSLRAAKSVIEAAEHVRLTGRDSLRVLHLLEHPPAPNSKLRAAARAIVCHCYRYGDIVRIISARRANRSERTQYEDYQNAQEL